MTANAVRIDPNDNVATLLPMGGRRIDHDAAASSRACLSL